MTSGTRTTAGQGVLQGQRRFDWATLKPIAGQSPQRRQEQDVNVGDAERLVTGVLGAGLVGWALYRRSIPSAIVAGIGAALAYRAYSGHSATYRALGVTPEDAHTYSHPLTRAIHAHHSVTVNKPPEEVYRFWRNVENLPCFMLDIEFVKDLGNNRSAWTGKTIFGAKLHWESEITQDQENRRIGWRSVEGSDVHTEGMVEFEPAPQGRGTQVRVRMRLQPPAGVLGAAAASLMGQGLPRRVRQNLERFKQLIETGELATIEGQPMGQCR